jgi:uncharacterized membrane protein (UPF0127 family)
MAHCRKQNKRKISIILVLVLPIVVILIIAVLGYFFKKPIYSNNVAIVINGNDYFLEVAQNNREQQKGLSKRTELCSNCGMVFVFDREGKHSFWMKDTLIPLQILFVNNCTIVDVQEMSVEGDPANPQKTYNSKMLANKAIELNSNSVPKNVIGKRIEQLCN